MSLNCLPERQCNAADVQCVAEGTVEQLCTKLHNARRRAEVYALNVSGEMLHGCVQRYGLIALPCCTTKGEGTLVGSAALAMVYFGQRGRG